MIKKIIFAASIIFILAMNQLSASHPDSIASKLTTLDPDISQYFPRWKLCETDLQVQVYQAFSILGFEKKLLDKENIVILAEPLPRDAYNKVPFELLLITCGEASMNSTEIETYLSALSEVISGERPFIKKGGPAEEEEANKRIRDYCFLDVTPDIPMTSSQADAIISYLEPTNVSHAFTLSLFEQSLKVGSSGFWLQSSIGTDAVGYPFWSSGESRVILKRPLYNNQDPRTRKKVPSLITAYLGFGYRLNSGLNTDNSILSWVPDRYLNAGPGGKVVGGFDFSMPFHPEFGFHLNAEIPLKTLNEDGIDEPTYAYVNNADNRVQFSIYSPNFGIYPINKTAYILRTTGQFSLYYNWWLNDDNPENYFRFDLGLSYCEVQEYACYRNTEKNITYLSKQDVEGLNFYHPSEFGDWLYAKVEFRNQAAYPFGVSMQYSNQTLLGRLYLPIFGNWFYLEGKYSTLLRGAKPFERSSFYMVSPVLRLTI